MKERPILFSGPMVRAILEGRKTQTRRIVKKQPRVDPETGDWLSTYSDGSEQRLPIAWWMELKLGFDCPYGQPGDRLWVRETWRPKSHQFPTGWPWEYKATCTQDLTPSDGPWRPSIHMPRAASRLLLEITDMRIERLDEINFTESIVEGIEYVLNDAGHPIFKNYLTEEFDIRNPSRSFMSLWASIHGPESWDANPWVWVISFRKLDSHANS